MINSIRILLILLCFICTFHCNYDRSYGVSQGEAYQDNERITNLGLYIKDYIKNNVVNMNDEVAKILYKSFDVLYVERMTNDYCAHHNIGSILQKNIIQQDGQVQESLILGFIKNLCSLYDVLIDKYSEKLQTEQLQTEQLKNLCKQLIDDKSQVLCCGLYLVLLNSQISFQSEEYKKIKISDVPFNDIRCIINFIILLSNKGVLQKVKDALILAQDVNHFLYFDRMRMLMSIFCILSANISAKDLSHNDDDHDMNVIDFANYVVSHCHKGSEKFWKMLSSKKLVMWYNDKYIPFCIYDFVWSEYTMCKYFMKDIKKNVAFSWWNIAIMPCIALASYAFCI